MPKQSNKDYESQSLNSMDMDFISIECLEKLGLDQNPFIDHARDPFLYSDDKLEMSVNVLMEYLSNQNSTLVLLGEAGIGKTTHLRMLLRKGYQKLNFCTLRAKPKTTFIDIESKIKERWSLPHSKDPDLINIDEEEYLSTDEHISTYIETDKHPVLIIDDAHRLSNEVLDQLLKLKHHVGLQANNTMGLVLAAESNIQTKLSELEQINPAATQIYQVNVRAFDTGQCERYLQYRLQQAGSISQDVFSPNRINEIFAHSKGLPKHINKLAREELTRQCEQGIESNKDSRSFTSSPGMRLSLILAGLIGLTILLGVLFKSCQSDNAPIALEIEKQNKPLNNESISKPYVAPLVLGPLKIDPPVSTASDKNQKESTQKNNIEAEKKLKQLSSESKEKPQQIESNPLSKATKKQTLRSSSWILEQDPNAYTIQIVASPNKNNLEDFVVKNTLHGDTAFYQKSSADKVWYILIHGVFSSREHALENIQNLPESIKKNSPYPIQIKHLQSLIQTN